MTVKVPIRTVFDGSNATGLAEFQSGEFIGLTHGGLGASLSIGSIGQVLKVNSSGTALEFGAVEAIVNIDNATNLTSNTLIDTDLFLVSDGGTEGRATLSQIQAAIKDTAATLTNKTISGSSNTLTNIDNSSLTNSNFTLTDDSSTTTTISLGETLKIAGGSGIDTSISGDTLTIALESTVVTETSTDTLTNKSISLSTNTITGTLAEFNTAVSDADLVSLAGSETLTNKTISGSSNTLSNIGNSSLTNPSFTIVDDTSSTGTIALGESLKFVGGTGIDTVISGDNITFSVDNTVPTKAFAIAQAIALG